MSVKGSSSTEVPVTVSGNINKDIKVPIPDTFDGNRNKYRYWMVQVDMYTGFYTGRFTSETEKVLWVITLLRGSAWD
ncbi:hypothetical protein BKA64DRAFT_668095 [Cadophora sp. MPI-SDFR-AT-0126]|nr:hypothetical protein BKA64DRAFT_668095 [Leotiomycetes sp. MPI-SDFR-AT-0126]